VFFPKNMTTVGIDQFAVGYGVALSLSKIISFPFDFRFL